MRTAGGKPAVLLSRLRRGVLRRPPCSCTATRRITGRARAIARRRPCGSRGCAAARSGALLRPVVLVLDDADHAGALAACVFLHLHEHGEPPRELVARLALVVEDQRPAVRAAHVAPDARLVL